MSKGQHGNREAKKPKKQAAKPVLPADATPAVAPLVPDRLRKR
jgi:hypothetical protein